MEFITQYNESLIREKQIYLLQILDCICQKYKIKYFLVGGSYLGTVKYKNFVPGDKDIDVGMLREDYDKFIRFLMLENTPYLRLVNCKTENNFNWFFSKICIKNTNFSNGREPDYGIFIDVIPYDYVSSNKILRKLSFYKAKILKWLFIIRDENSHPILYTMLSVFDRNHYLNYVINHSLNRKESSVVENLFCGRSEDWFYMNEIVNLEQSLFYNDNFPVPHAIRYLNANYPGWQSKHFYKKDLYEYQFKVNANDIK